MHELQRDQRGARPWRVFQPIGEVRATHPSLPTSKWPSLHRCTVAEQCIQCSRTGGGAILQRCSARVSRAASPLLTLGADSSGDDRPSLKGNRGRGSSSAIEARRRPHRRKMASRPFRARPDFQADAVWRFPSVPADATAREMPGSSWPPSLNLVWDVRPWVV